MNQTVDKSSVTNQNIAPFKYIAFDVYVYDLFVEKSYVTQAEAERRFPALGCFGEQRFSRNGPLRHT